MAAPTIELTTSGQGFSYARLTGPISTHTDSRQPSGAGIVEDENKYGFEAATEPGWRLKQIKYTIHWRFDYYDGTYSSDEEEMVFPLYGYEWSSTSGFFNTIESFTYSLDNDGNLILSEKYTRWYEDVVIETERDDLVEISVTRSPKTEAEAQAAGGRVAEAGTTTYYAYPRETLTISLQATPLPGYRFARWHYPSSSRVTIADSSSAFTTASIEVQYGWSSVGFNFTAVFERITCTVTLAVTPPGCGTASWSGVYNLYSNISVTATPAEGCSFLRWTTYNGITVSRQRVYSFRVEGDTYLVAHFHRWANLILRSASSGAILHGANNTILHDA